MAGEAGYRAGDLADQAVPGLLFCIGQDLVAHGLDLAHRQSRCLQLADRGQWCAHQAATQQAEQPALGSTVAAMPRRKLCRAGKSREQGLHLVLRRLGTDQRQDDPHRSLGRLFVKPGSGTHSVDQLLHRPRVPYPFMVCSNEVFIADWRRPIRKTKRMGKTSRPSAPSRTLPMTDNSILIGASATGKEVLYLPLANRHGLITGATGTGKTVTLQILAEGFSEMGVPVFAADVKGDLSGISQPGQPTDALLARAKEVGLDDYGFAGMPTVYWDLFGKQGHPIRTTISEMGPLLLSRLMGLTEAQEGALNIAFRIADEEGLLLLDLPDLRALLSDLAQRGKSITTDYGNVGATTIGAIQRRLVVLEEQGGEHFFGEPALDIHDLMRTTRDGRGCVNILAADQLMASPQLYATFLLWLLSEIFEDLPEVGDPDKPKLVFFFDEAHLLFNDAPPGLLQKIEQVVRLSRSKGVGVYFVTQNPLDVPDTVLAQLGNKLQHALRIGVIHIVIEDAESLVGPYQDAPFYLW